jgi:hypothetical protein
LTVTTVPESRISPDVYWENVYRSTASLSEKAAGDLQGLMQVSTVIADLISWTEKIIDVRIERRESWFSGKAWMNFTDLWIGIARRVSIDVYTASEAHVRADWRISSDR